MGERQTSLLTNSQREHLRKSGTGSAARMARKRVKERVYEGLHDFPLLVDAYEREGLSQAFEDRNLEENDHTLNVLPSAFAFLYLGITDTVEPEDLAKDAFEDFVGQGVKRAYQERGESVAKVEVSVDVTRAESDKPVEDMTLGEIQALARTGELDLEEAIDRLADRRMAEKLEEGSLSAENGPSENYKEWLAKMLFPEDESG